MPKDKRNTIDVLKAELDFVKQGGYEKSMRDPWSVKLALEDSATCMNCDHKKNPVPCSECLLMQFVPANRRNEKIPCRHIPLTTEGDTLLQMYRGSTEEEIDKALSSWLQKTISQLEVDGKSGQKSSTLH
jgi:hypothetical protein